MRSRPCRGLTAESRRLLQCRIGRLFAHLSQQAVPGGGIRRHVGAGAVEVFQEGSGGGIALGRLVGDKALEDTLKGIRQWFGFGRLAIRGGGDPAGGEAA